MARATCGGTTRTNAWDGQGVTAITSSSLPRTQPQLLPSGPGESSAVQPAAGMQEEDASTDLARMIALDGYDPSVVDNKYFRSFLRRLNPQFEVPSRRIIEEKCDGIFDETRRDLFSKLGHISGRVSLQVGKATIREAGQVVLYTICHFIDDEWNLYRMVMDAYVDVPFVGYHCHTVLVPEINLGDPDAIEQHFDEINLGDPDSIEQHFDEVMDGLIEHDILDRLFMVARETRADGEIDRLENFFSDTYAMGRGLVCTTYLDKELDSIADELFIDNKFLKELCSHMENINLTRQKREQHLGLDFPWAYGKHWYYCYCCLRVLDKECHSTIADKKIFTEVLCKIWGKICRAIQAISATSCPTSNLILVELFNVRDVLQSELEQVSGEDADLYNGSIVLSDNENIAEVIREAKDSVDGVIQDSYLVWCIPLVLDPRYKLRYIKFIFQRAFGSDAADYISEVTKRMEEMYSDYVEDYGDVAMVGGSVDPLQQAWDEHRQTQAKTELDRYLMDCSVVSLAHDFDILKWWKDNSRNYPTVSRMARDALAMPTRSKVSSEQMAHLESMVRGYSKEPCPRKLSWWPSSSGGGGDAMIQ